MRDHAAALARWQARTARGGRTPAPGRSRVPGASQAQCSPTLRRAPEVVECPLTVPHEAAARRRTVVVMPWARTPLSLNARLGWAATNRARQDITEAVAWATRGVEPHRTPVEVEIIRYLGGDGVADPDNLAATLKPTIDALVPRVLPTDDARTVVRTAQRVIPAERDPLGLGHPRLLLVITEARPDEFEHYGAAGEVTGWA